MGLANLFLFYYEFKWLDKQRIEDPHRLKFFKSCCRYIDDLFLVNNNDLMKKYMLEIYPKELNLIPDETDGQSVPFLDLLINIKEGVISTSIFDKRDAFNFPIANFPILSGTYPTAVPMACLSGKLFATHGLVHIMMTFYLESIFWLKSSKPNYSKTHF